VAMQMNKGDASHQETSINLDPDTQRSNLRKETQSISVAEAQDHRNRTLTREGQQERAKTVPDPSTINYPTAIGYPNA
jgi:hypothetical protein